LVREAGLGGQVMEAKKERKEAVKRKKKRPLSYKSRAVKYERREESLMVYYSPKIRYWQEKRQRDSIRDERSKDQLRHPQELIFNLGDNTTKNT
jgi:hypothetical protein